MTSHLLNCLVEELNVKLGDRPFYTLSELKSIGFFGSLPSARRALREKRLAFVKISPRRFVIPRTVLLEYLRNNISEEVDNDTKA